MNELQSIWDNADLLAFLCEQTADYRRRIPNPVGLEGFMGISGLTKELSPEQWDDLAAQLRRLARMRTA